MRSAHHHRHPGGANGIGHPVSFRNHTRHRADPDQPDALRQHETDDLGIAHRLCVAVDQQHFVSRGRKCLQEKHPEVRHEVCGHAIVGIVKQNTHGKHLFRPSSGPWWLWEGFSRSPQPVFLLKPIDRARPDGRSSASRRLTARPLVITQPIV